MESIMRKELLILLAACLTITGCKSKNGNTWDDHPVATHYKGLQSLWGQAPQAQEEPFFSSSQEDFIALNNEDLKQQFADDATPQPKHSPGDRGSGLPGIEGFHSPSGQEASIFKTLYFNTDEHILRSEESLQALDQIAKFLKAHPSCYIFVAGHCDERGPEAYNLALGTRRANYVRGYLIKQGVNLNQIHTISYGKERPCNLAHTPDAWSQNRRAEFKIYNRS